MKTWTVKIDNANPYRQSCNVFAEILDDAQPRHSGSVLVTKREAGLVRGGKGWEMSYDATRRYVWDDFEGEWASFIED